MDNQELLEELEHNLIIDDRWINKLVLWNIFVGLSWVLVGAGWWLG